MDLFRRTRDLEVALRAFSIGFAIALVSWSEVTAFAAPPPPLVPQGAVSPSIRLPLSAHPGVLYSFGGGSNAAYGANPQDALIDVNGVLYGTTRFGGEHGVGTVFSVTAAGVHRVLHNFALGPDGSNPRAGLIDVNGVLYGTTVYGGLYGGGTIFAVTTAGAERVIHSFRGGGAADATTPEASLINVNGVLYGTAYYGGQHGYGAVFAITTAGSERVVYSFGGGTDAQDPLARLVDVNGVLYGTTAFGGTYYDPFGNGYGTVFAVTAAGSERVLHDFGNGSDGGRPTGGLIDVGGVLYGTTIDGGRYGQGTVFAITTDGAERVIHNFGNGADGRGPYATLTDVNGVLYGTTEYGGRNGRGTIFAITTAGSEHVIRNFGFCNGPIAQLVYANGYLYGTTEYGGLYKSGTLFFESP